MKTTNTLISLSAIAGAIDAELAMPSPSPVVIAKRRLEYLCLADRFANEAVRAYRAKIGLPTVQLVKLTNPAK